ncbi:aminotransferase class IV [Spongisporangium articulatum]|uniref:Aminotransferase class IV n=1 Tax=Spongisporangium articulatum TaxID=3362603 RepID=A0ABW8ASG7_9ACTN
MTTLWVNGRIVAPGESGVSALDHGLTVGDGIFETALVDDGRPFALTRHLRRLERSAALVGMSTPTETEIRAAIEETLAAAAATSPVTHGRLRITVTSGVGPLGSDRGDAAPSLIVGVVPTGAWPAEVRAVTVPWTRNERSAVAGAKTTSYAENVVALAEAHRRDAHEALLANTRGELCEGTGSNVVVVLDGELLTPPLSSGCLAGITRELFLEWAGQEGLAVVEKDLPFDVLAEAEGVLLTSSTRGVQPLAAIDGRPLERTEAGEKARELYDRRAAEGIDP